jgi:hypothetical protein
VTHAIGLVRIPWTDVLEALKINFFSSQQLLTHENVKVTEKEAIQYFRTEG